MRSRAVGVILAVAALLCSTAGLAQAPTQRRAGGQTGGNPPARPRPPIDTALDANGDEIIDAGEIAAAPAALQKLDKNGDGRLTPEEVLPARPGRDATKAAGTPPPPDRQQARRGPKLPIVTAIDANGDGVLDAGEIAAAATALLKLDKNGDGRLTPDEYRPPRPSGEDRAADPRPDGIAGARTTTEENITAASTEDPVISGVLLAFDPLRLIISGDRFVKGATVLIAGKAAPVSTVKSPGLIVATGSGLESALPKGSTVSIVVLKPGGKQSLSWRFTR